MTSRLFPTVYVTTDAQRDVARLVVSQARCVRSRLEDLQRFTNHAVDRAAAGSTMPVQLASSAALVDTASAELVALCTAGRAVGLTQAQLDELAADVTFTDVRLNYAAEVEAAGLAG